MRDYRTGDEFVLGETIYVCSDPDSNVFHIAKTVSSIKLTPCLARHTFETKCGVTVLFKAVDFGAKRLCKRCASTVDSPGQNS